MLGGLLAMCVSSSDASLRSEELKRFTFTEYHMGVDARLVIYASTQYLAEIAGKDAFDRIAELDTCMSDYRKESELNNLCAKAGGPPVKVSADLFKVLKRANEISRRTDGAFDVTVGPLVQLWRAARKSGQLPDPASIRTARVLVGWRKMKLNDRDRTVQLTTPGMKLDLGGIAKGFADDEAQKVLQRHGIKSALVEMGGDIVVSDPPPGSKGWILRVPNAGDNNTPKDLPFSNCAISTSGDTEQFVVIGGVQYSHVVDPRTGQALTNRVQATVIAKDGFTTDPLSKVPALLDDRDYSRILKLYGVKKTYIKRLPGVG